jgi:AmmeMemoRadiSam system protein A
MRRQHIAENKEYKMQLTDKEKNTLLDIVKNAITAKINHKDMPEFNIDSETIKEKRGAFVTLKKHGHLRGCIGYIKPVKPLAETVQEMAIAAAFHDPRFPSLKPNEVNDLTFEISVLSPLKRINNINEIEVGKHGLYMVRGYNSGLLLPQVAIEYKWDREAFLKETCYKAGLPLDAWMDEATEIYIFSADYFGDTD